MFAATSSIRVADTKIMATSSIGVVAARSIRVEDTKDVTETTTGTTVSITRWIVEDITEVTEEKVMITTINFQ
jgi:hypothetical protein